MADHFNVLDTPHEHSGTYGQNEQRVKSGWYLHPGGTRATGVPLYERVHVMGIQVPACTVDRIGAEITGAGPALSVVRLGIYSADADGMPGALLLDAGTIDGTSATAQEITISQALAVGIYYLAAAAQLGGSSPTMRTVTGVAHTPRLSSSLAAVLTSPAPGLVTFGGAAPGALPASLVLSSSTSTMPVISVRFA